VLTHRSLASIEQKAARFSGGKDKRKCCGVHLNPLFPKRSRPRTYPLRLRSGPFWIRSWRFGAKLGTIVRRGLECHRLLRENHSRSADETALSI
jgi:hypothetical protein